MIRIVSFRLNLTYLIATDGRSASSLTATPLLSFDYEWRLTSLSQNATLRNGNANGKQTAKKHLEGKTSRTTLSRIQELESLGFGWDILGAGWEDYLSDRADFRKIHGHCNVSHIYSENTRLGTWVSNRRKHYKLHRLERSSERACRLPQNPRTLQCSSKLQRKRKARCVGRLGAWVGTQRSKYRLQTKGKESRMTLPRIQAAENLVCVNRLLFIYSSDTCSK
jgi:hypothetical protein